jgi:hypothetical protein
MAGTVTIFSEIRFAFRQIYETERHIKLFTRFAFHTCSAYTDAARISLNIISEGIITISHLVLR